MSLKVPSQTFLCHTDTEFICSAPEFTFLVVSDLLLDYSCVDYLWEFSENVPTNHTVLLSDWFGLFFCGSLELRQLLVGVLFCSCVFVGRLTFRSVAK